MDIPNEIFTRSVFSEPTPKEESILDIEWRRYNPNSTAYLHIGTDQCRMSQHLRPHQVSLWNNLVPQLVHKFSELDRLRAIRVYDVELWIFVGLTGVMTIMVLVLLVILCRMTKGHADYSWNKNSVPV